MNKNQKRQLNLKNKLLAAIAMLLVSSIMMVSTTYAWFTLSTAPEVQGITTTVGANGNLEIALSPASGDYNLITTGTNDSNADWVVKNQTWGNLLDLSDASYRLNELSLLPARLNINEGTNNTTATLGLNPLSVPVYGADGRISQLKADGVELGGYGELGEVSGFLAGNKAYGVRAVGTSSSMTPDQLAFNSALSAMNSNATVASTLVANALNTYGAALADMAVKHATAGDTDTNDYSAYADDLQAISAELIKASDSVETSLYNALLALAKSAKAQELFPSDYDTLYGTIKTNMDNGISLATTWSQLPAGAVTLMEGNSAGKVLVGAYEKWEATDAAVAANASAVNALDASASISWTQISSAMSGLMNINNVTVSGYSLDEVKENIFAIMQSGGIVLQLNAGSGVIANFGELSGNILATVYLSAGMQYQDNDLEGAQVNIATTTQPAAGPVLTQVRTLVAAIGAATGGDAANVIDVVYGYAIDFVFRTNAANSSLLLQTEGTDRIYDGTDGATMGNGSTITFSDKSNNLQSLVSMMNGIRVVFTNTKGDVSNVYGIAKIKFDNIPLKLNVTSVTREIVDNTDAEGNVTYTEKFTEGAAADTEWLLSVDGSANSNMILTTEELAENHKYIVWETVKDETTGELYAKATVKTALWTTIDTTVVTTPAGDGATPTTTADTVDVEITVNGTPLFFEDLDSVNALGELVEETEVEQVTRLLAEYGITELTYEDTYTDEDGATVVITGTQTVDADAIDLIAAVYDVPVYQYVKDQDVTLEGPLALYNYTLNAGMLVFGEPMDVQALTTLDQNVATGVTAMVYLDGDYVDNGDVSNSVDGISNTGTLNLQFASSATLVPMTNSTLQNSIGVKFPTVEGMDFVGEAMATKETEYKFTATGMDAAKSYKFTAKVGEETVDLGTYTGVAEQLISVPADKTTANIEIIVEDVTPPAVNP